MNIKITNVNIQFNFLSKSSFETTTWCVNVLILQRLHPQEDIGDDDGDNDNDDIGGSSNIPADIITTLLLLLLSFGGIDVSTSTTVGDTITSEVKAFFNEKGRNVFLGIILFFICYTHTIFFTIQWNKKNVKIW